MPELNRKIGVGIAVPTMNRPDFVTRLLNYYASLNYKDTIYIGDSSNKDNANIIKNEIEKLKNKINVDYRPFNDGDGGQCLIYLLSNVKEKYVTFIGDDDYNVPDTMYACAEFLENNPDYETATGKSVTIRIKDNKTYGEITSIHDYPRHSIEEETGSERLFDHFAIHFNSIIASILPTEKMLKYYVDSIRVKDVPIRSEILPCALMIISGKSKVLDRLGLIRQIHSKNLRNADIFDQITHKDWPESYDLTKKILVDALISKDKLSQGIAEETIKKCFWANLNGQLITFYPQYISLTSSPTEVTKDTEKKLNIRNRVATNFPLVKNFYRKLIRPILANKEQLHYDVLQPNSKYYDDFQRIVRSITKPQ